MQPNSFYSKKELAKIGFKKMGKEVFISKFASFYSPELMEIGNHVRIDDFCILSGNIKLGSYIHISAYCALYGKLGIELEDFVGLSPRCSLLSASDDFSGEYMIGPLVNEKYTHVTGGKIWLKKYTQLGACCVVLPNVTINEGVAVGSMSLINHSLEEWSIFKGIPARKHAERKKGILKLEKQFLRLADNPDMEEI
jgi:acetyltransferase-like isoleucine patch superfamily enzyme